MTKAERNSRILHRLQDICEPYERLVLKQYNKSKEKVRGVSYDTYLDEAYFFTLVCSIALMITIMGCTIISILACVL